MDCESIFTENFRQAIENIALSKHFPSAGKPRSKRVCARFSNPDSWFPANRGPPTPDCCISGQSQARMAPPESMSWRLSPVDVRAYAWRTASFNVFSLTMVFSPRVELGCRVTHVPETCASANSATKTYGADAGIRTRTPFDTGS